MPECDRSPFTSGGNRTHVGTKEPSYDGSLIPLGYRSTYRIDRSPFTGGGDRTHVAVPKNLRSEWDAGILAPVMLTAPFIDDCFCYLKQ